MEVCYEADVRLVNGSIRSEGRVEYCTNDTWFTVCNDVFDNQIFDNDWGMEEATVVCRQFRYVGATLSLLLPQFNSSILDRRWSCSGSEMSLVQCSVSSNTSDCAAGGVACHRITCML